MRQGIADSPSEGDVWRVQGVAGVGERGSVEPNPRSVLFLWAGFLDHESASGGGTRMAVLWVQSGVSIG